MKLSLKLAGLLVAATIALSACTKQPHERAEKADKHEAAETKESSSTAKRDVTKKPEENEGEARVGQEASVTLKGEALEQAEIKTAVVGRRSVESSLVTTGEVVSNPDREAHVTPRTPGRVIRLVKSVGDWVEAGEPLAILESVELGEAQSEYLAAQAHFNLTEKTVERQRQLLKRDLAAQKDVQAAENQLELAQIDLEKAKNKLTLFGFSNERTASLARTRKLDPTIPLLAPIQGAVVEKHVTLGEMLQPDAQEPAFKLSDTTKLWVNANIYERDLTRVREGQTVTVTAAAFPGKTYRGQVSRISAELDPTTRTAKARVVLPNPDRRLKPEMFVSVQIRVGREQALAVPSSAVLQDKSDLFAFVQTAPGRFEKRRLKVGDRATEFYPVLAGLKAGEQVVVSGGFTLKSELLKESFGEEE